MFGRVHGFQRDYLGQVTGETHPDLGSGTFYKYDLNGNRSQVTRNGLTEYYGYDLGDRLLWTNTGTPTAPNQPPTSNQTAAYGIYGWDDFGQLQRRERRDKAGLPVYKLDFYWDTASRLRYVKQLGATASQAVIFTSSYAADGERIYKQDRQGTIVRDHTYSFGLHDTNGNTAYTPGFAHRSAGTDRFYHSDWLGSTRYLTDAAGGGSGTLGYASAARFDAFGQRTAVAGTDGTYGTDRQYAGAWGYERERPGGAELGLDYLYQRYYDPAIGRFISRDPIRWAGGLNLYGYVGNDPVTGVDPWGLDYQDAVDAVASARSRILDLSRAFGLQPELLAGIVWIENYAGGAPGWHRANDWLSKQKFLGGDRASLGIASVQQDPDRIPGCETRTGRSTYLGDFYATLDSQLVPAIELLKSLVTRPNRYQGRPGKLSRDEIAIILTEYNIGARPSPASSAAPGPYGRTFLNFLPDIKSVLYTGQPPKRGR